MAVFPGLAQLSFSSRVLPPLQELIEQFEDMNEGPFTELPANLPIPVDDGACAHLPGKSLPLLTLPSTNGGQIDLGSIRGQVVIYAYPMTGRPGVALPIGWDQIPGARGCTPESCGFRDHYSELRSLGVEVYGLSTQTTDYQGELRERLHLPFDLLSDHAFALTDELDLPTFTIASMRLLKRLTLICHQGQIRHVFYPIFPPNLHAAQVVAWMKEHELGKTARHDR